jgi:hypothetical protein
MTGRWLQVNILLLRRRGGCGWSALPLPRLTLRLGARHLIARCREKRDAVRKEATSPVTASIRLCIHWQVIHSRGCPVRGRAPDHTRCRTGRLCTDSEIRILLWTSES